MIAIVEPAQKVPVNIVGGSTFGRYPKISLEKTYNMYVTDDWLVNFAGYKKIEDIAATGKGRGLFHSTRGNVLIAVVGSGVFEINQAFVPRFIGNLESAEGEVFIDENLNEQIAISDGEDIYIYSRRTGALTKQILTFVAQTVRPGYVTFHNTFFLIGSNPSGKNSNNWYAAEFSTDDTITIDAKNAFPLQTKPDDALAVLRLPARGNNVAVFGSSVTEVWTQVGGEENYRRVQSFNIDSGVVSVSTIAANEELICWLAKSQNNTPSIMITDGSGFQRISTDGIDYLLQTIKFPEQSTAVLYRQDGHLFYQLTFFNNVDNLTLTYDFNTKLFFHRTDEKLHYHPMRQVVFFQGKTLFASINDPVLYESSTDLLTYKYTDDQDDIGEVIPRIRICKGIRKGDSEFFRVKSFSFWIEQGVTNFVNIPSLTPEICSDSLVSEEGESLVDEDGFTQLIPENAVCFQEIVERPRIDFSYSKNGNQSFSNVSSYPMNAKSNFINRVNFHRLGRANEFTVQVRFWGFQRFVANNGYLEIY